MFRSFSLSHGLKITNRAKINVSKNCEITLHDFKITKAGVSLSKRINGLLNQNKN